MSPPLTYPFFAPARTPRIIMLLLHPQIYPPPPLSSLQTVPRHDGTGMQTALIMTFTVCTTVWAVGKAPRSGATHTPPQ